MSTTLGQQSAKTLVDGIRQKLESIRNELMAEMSGAMGEAMQSGQEIAQDRIEMSITRTGIEREAMGQGRPGRIDTGDYIDDFKHEAYQVNRDQLQGRFGWLDGGQEANAAGGKSYFELQENGFTAKGTAVAPVHALLDASEVAKAEFKKRLADYVKREYK
ncbi:hypothetical protein [Frigoribacterium sp. CG_9.8]|uniref:hypothetical protein n=1 Tax=Frigoribacterium sp. CG_9.8 TaxID=2787733 RepID=UPI0018C991CA|nr:hypothetical protein [Frigoribacterium sp. CG_9.8]MBG6106644.1 hypothetical protein [Frigoribacterium sp. CG_9.8]